MKRVNLSVLLGSKRSTRLLGLVALSGGFPSGRRPCCVNAGPNIRQRKFQTHSTLAGIGVLVLVVCAGALRVAASGPITLKSSAIGGTSFPDNHVTVSCPAGVAAGDVMIAQVAVRGGSSQYLVPPAGWARVRSDAVNSMMIQAVYSHIVSSSLREPASYTWNYEAGYNAVAGIADFTGVSALAPVDVSNGRGNSSSTTSIRAPSLTIATGHTRDFLMGMFAISNGSPIAVPPGHNKVWSFRAVGWGVGIAMSDVNPAGSGPTGNWVATAGRARPNVGALVALLPAIASAAPTWTATASATSTPVWTATPTPVPSKALTAVPSPTPTAASTPILNAYYVDNSPTGCGGSGCSDSNNGISPLSAWKTVAHVQSIMTSLTPGQAVLFARGDTWNEQLSAPGAVNGSAGHPITFGNYGAGALPVIDGGGTRVSCFDFEGSGSGISPVFSYITLDGFECRDTTQHAVEFLQLNGGNTSGMPGITVQNFYIHNTGPGAYAGGSGPYDPGPYQYTGQLMLEDFGKGPSGIRLLNNTIHYVGGHNAIRVEGDAGGPLIEGNDVSQWVHNAIDQKGVTNSVVDGNVIHDSLPGDTSPGMYTENTGLPAKVDSITFQRNVAYNVITGIQCEDLSTIGGVTVCHIYNNTLIASGQSIYGDANSPCNINWDIRNNILDSTSAMYQGSNCGNPTIWDYNDDCATQNSCQVKMNGAIYTSISALQAVAGGHDLWQINPLYGDAAANQYQLQPGSSLIGAGLANLVSGMRDIGAY